MMYLSMMRGALSWPACWVSYISRTAKLMHSSFLWELFMILSKIFYMSVKLDCSLSFVLILLCVLYILESFVPSVFLFSLSYLCLLCHYFNSSTMSPSLFFCPFDCWDYPSRIFIWCMPDRVSSTSEQGRLPDLFLELVAGSRMQWVSRDQG